MCAQQGLCRLGLEGTFRQVPTLLSEVLQHAYAEDAGCVVVGRIIRVVQHLAQDLDSSAAALMCVSSTPSLRAKKGAFLVRIVRTNTV